ncbi:3-oxoacyl-ACP reductase [Burkholderia sp. Nafp2/4-1b]|uniref:SDR family oxidoreductase n=1 Tax=Burkholderia sp. Nafp2/4-1b TaxID=2116686 RepID=UPI000EF8DA0C|nr:SDR family oxidoreductase [Burkholderia sp. Nafp2/4-1b]RKU00052.1 3-oxoacyl-ACP reductase [Burkholderia sp. Nafp2/4-1b]
MDLNIRGRKALVCAGSKGLGRSCAMALADDGVILTIVARSEGPLEATAKDIREATGVEVTTVVADITTPAGRELALKACPAPDILVNNAGGPKPGDFRSWSRDDWIHALDANMLAPIEMIRLTIDGMMERKFGRIVNITSSAVKAPIDSLGLSNGARSGLTGFVAGLARKTIANNVTINNLLPGSFATDRLTSIVKAQSQSTGLSEEAVTQDWLQKIPAGRFGNPDEFGKACAFLCSSHAGFISGLNLLIDGAAYPGTF